MKIINNNKTLIGSLLICIVAAWYTYYENTSVSYAELTEITGTLREKPFPGEQGGDMPRKFIRIELNEIDKKFYLIDCAYDMSKKKDILELKPNSYLTLSFKKNDIEKKKLMYTKPFQVISTCLN